MSNSTHKVADGSPTKGAVVSFLATARNAREHGYNCDWPIGIVIWNLHQCTKQAQDLATAMYSCILQSISDAKLREDVSQMQGNLISLLLALRRRFGSNAGVLHIQRAAAFGTLKPFSESTELEHELRQFLKYHEETNIFVYQFSSAMARLDEFIPKERDTAARNELLQIYNSKLLRFGSDPLSEAQKLLTELVDELIITRPVWHFSTNIASNQRHRQRKEEAKQHGTEVTMHCLLQVWLELMHERVMQVLARAIRPQ